MIRTGIQLDLDYSSSLVYLALSSQFLATITAAIRRKDVQNEAKYSLFDDNL